MRTLLKVSPVALVLAIVGYYTFFGTRVSSQPSGAAGAAALASIGPLAFGPDGTLFVADPLAATVFAFDHAPEAPAVEAGTAAVEALNVKLAEVLEAGAVETQIVDVAVHPQSRNAFVAVMHGPAARAVPALFRVDGAGSIARVTLDGLESSRVALPNAPPTSGIRAYQRRESITDMEFDGGQLWVSGLSNQEFGSTIRRIGYPFKSADAGTAVEIYHGNHGAWETESPAYTFARVPINGTPHLVAGYLCTPLVTFPLSALTPGAKVRGTTIAELGDGNRPVDLIVYTKGGTDYLLLSNESRGVMKMPAAALASAAPITAPVAARIGGVKYETIASMRGVTQMDRLDAERAVALAEGAAGFDLRVLPLP